MAEKKKTSLAFKLLIGMATVMLSLTGGIYAYGLSQDAEHTATGSEVVNAPLAKVFAMQADPREVAKWKEQIAEVRDYRDLGGGLASWREVWKDDNQFDFVITHYEHNKLLRIQITDLNEVFYGSWTLAFEAAGEGTRVTITEKGTIPNAFVRGAFHLSTTTDATLMDHLSQLKVAAERGDK